MTQPRQEQKHDFLFKIVMIGDHGVGKTQLIMRYTKNEFQQHSTTTIGVEFTTRTLTIDGKLIGAQLWDTAGEEKYKSLTSIYYKGAVGAILVYDITRKDTFDRICTQWLNELKNFSDPNIVAILIGNKCDLKEKREVQTDEATSFAERNGTCSKTKNIGIAFMETSAKDSINVQVAFERVLNEIYKIATKNAVKEVRPSITQVSKGKKLDEEETAEPFASQQKNKGKIKLNAKKSKEKKKGCC